MKLRQHLKPNRWCPGLLVLALVLPWSRFLVGQEAEQEKLPKVLEELRVAAEQGDARAQSALANAFLNGQGVNKNPGEAAKWFLKAAEQNDPISQFILGLLYDGGTGVETNKAEAAKWFEKAAEKGLPQAQYNLAVVYSKGEGLPRDPTKAAHYYKLAAEQGERNAQLQLGIALRDGDGVEKNPEEAATWLRRSAYQGNAVAQYAIAQFYQAGVGVARSLEDAFKWYRRSAEQGLPLAQYALGLAYLQGDGVPRDPELAVPWFRKAAESGNSNAQLLLGLAYQTGNGVKQDPDEAFKWLSKAMVQGNVEAQRILTRSNPPPVAPVMTANPVPNSLPRPDLSVTGPRPGGSDASFPTLLVVTSVGTSLVVLIPALFALAALKARMNSLEREIKEAKHELTKANVSLSTMVQLVESRALRSVQAVPPAQLHAPAVSTSTTQPPAPPRALPDPEIAESMKSRRRKATEGK